MPDSKISYTIEKAIKVASAYHSGQHRKVSKLPYIVHPLTVGTILAGYTEDEEVIAAGILHDVLEDTNCTEAELQEKFGTRVRDYVKEVSEEKTRNGKPVPWKERKDQYLKRLETTPLGEALLISAADKCHNLQSLRDDHKHVGDKLWILFGGAKEEQRWFYGEHLRILHERLNSPIVSAYQKLFDEAQPIFE